jgi:hypothetical protein
MKKKSNKKETSQLVLKFLGATDETTTRLRRLLMHYTGKLVTKTECDEKADEEENEDCLDLNTEPETETTAELTVNLNGAEAEYILEKILNELEFDRSVSEANRAIKKLEKGA